MTETHPVYQETIAAIDRFLDGRYNPAQLRSWLMVHFDVEHADPMANQLWTGLMMLLAVYNAGDFARADLIESVRQLRDAPNPLAAIFRTPLGQMRSFHDITFSPNPPWPIQRKVTPQMLNDQRHLEDLGES